MNQHEIQAGGYYRYRKVDRSDNIVFVFDAIVDIKMVSTDYSYIEGDVVTFIENTLQWSKEGLSLSADDFVEEVTLEDNPEYWL